MSSAVYSELDERVLFITFNRLDKHNAFDDGFLKTLHELLLEANRDDKVRVIVIKANGPHFSAGADLAWMQRIAMQNEAENIADASAFAETMYTLYSCPKPTIAMVQGAAFGGGAGLVAACDIALAAKKARFCFSEVKLGLIPAVISPYVIRAIGERVAAQLFMTAETIDAERALQLQLIHYCVSDEQLFETTYQKAHALSKLAPMAVKESKQWVRDISTRAIDTTLLQQTARTIAKRRMSAEGQRGMRAFLAKESLDWS